MKEDSRKVRYTRKVIREAYFELLKQKPVAQMTIGELCGIADIHRGTFYQHYHDIYDLREKIMEEMLARFIEMFPDTGSEDPDIVEMTVMAVYEERDIFCAILGPNGSTDVMDRFIESCRPRAYSRFRKIGIEEKDFRMVFTFYTSGIICLIRDWSMNGYREKPEEVIATIRKLTRMGIGGFTKADDEE